MFTGRFVGRFLGTVVWTGGTGARIGIAAWRAY
jgi:hypothetical protein